MRTRKSYITWFARDTRENQTKNASETGMSAGAVVGRVEGGGGRRRKRRELTEEQKQEIGEAFALFDSDKDQALDYHELKVSTEHPISHDTPEMSTPL